MKTFLTKGNILPPIETEIHDRIKNGRGDTCLLIVPTAHARLARQRECLEFAPNRAVVGLHIHTFEDVVGRVYQQIGGSDPLGRARRQLSAGLQTVWMREIVDQQASTFLRPYPEIPAPQGTVTRLVGAINQLKMSGVLPSDLRQEVAAVEAGEEDTERQKINELIEIYEAYEQKLSTNWIDRGGIHREVAGTVPISGVFTASFPNVNLVVVEGFDVFSPLDFAILTGIARLPRLDMAVVLDFNAENESLFGHVRQSYDGLINLGFETHSSNTPTVADIQCSADAPVGLPNPTGNIGIWQSQSSDEPEPRVGLAYHSDRWAVPTLQIDAEARERHFSQNLFRKGRESQVVPLNLTDKITVVQASNRTQEVESTAQLIKRLVLEYHDRSFGSALNTKTSPPTSLLQGEGRESVRIVTPPLIGEAGRGPKFASLPLNQICVTYPNLDLYAPLIREIFPLYGIPYTLANGGMLANSPLITAIFGLLEGVNGSVRGRHRAMQSPYFSIVDWQTLTDESQFTDKMPPAGFCEAFGALMETVHLRRQILNQTQLDPSIIAAEIAAYRRFCSLIDELIEFFRLEHGDAGEHSLRDYISRLRLMVSQTPYQVQSPNRGGVQILPLVQTKNLAFEIVILGGLVDGEFPSAFLPDAFLPATRRVTESDRLREDRFLFYQVFKCFRHHLYLTAPQRDGRAELVISPFIDELQRVAEIEVIEDSSEETAPLLSAERFRKQYGAFVWDGQDRKSALPAIPIVEHNVRVEKSRSVTHELPEYEGSLPADKLSSSSRGALENLRNKVYSVSQLEDYGECPFRYFARHLLLKPEDDATEEEGMNSLERGESVHKILFEFYRTHRDKLPLSNLTEAEFEAALVDLKRIARERLATYKRDGLFWEIDVEHLIGGHGRRGILPTFLEAERGRELEVNPRYFEVGFGLGESEQLDDKLNRTGAIKIGDITIKGKIDRVEIGDGIFTIGDYKTGSILPKIRDILEGRSLQLPIYLAVVEQLLNGELSAAGGIYYTVRDECKAELGIGDEAYNGRAFKASKTNRQMLPNAAVEGVESLQALITQVIEATNRYVLSISHGDFPLTPHDPKDVCGYCSFKRVCRVGTIGEAELGID